MSLEAVILLVKVPCAPDPLTDVIVVVSLLVLKAPPNAHFVE